MAESLEILAASTDTLNDPALALLVRSQLVGERISQGPWNGGVGDTGIPRAPVSFYIKAMQSQLADLRASIPMNLVGDGQYNVLLGLFLF